MIIRSDDAGLPRPRDADVERPPLRLQPENLAHEREVELLGVRIELGEVVETTLVAVVADADEAVAAEISGIIDPRRELGLLGGEYARGVRAVGEHARMVGTV